MRKAEMRCKKITTGYQLQGTRWKIERCCRKTGGRDVVVVEDIPI
jgi:hypothetical protein